MWAGPADSLLTSTDKKTVLPLLIRRGAPWQLTEENGHCAFSQNFLQEGLKAFHSYHLLIMLQG